MVAVLSSISALAVPMFRGQDTTQLREAAKLLAADLDAALGAGTALVTLPAAEIPAGQTTTLYLRLDDGLGLSWCMDYIVYVDLFQVGGTPPTPLP